MRTPNRHTTRRCSTSVALNTGLPSDPSRNEWLNLDGDGPGRGDTNVFGLSRAGSGAAHSAISTNRTSSGGCWPSPAKPSPMEFGAKLAGRGAARRTKLAAGPGRHGELSLRRPEHVPKPPTYGLRPRSWRLTWRQTGRTGALQTALGGRPSVQNPT